MNRKGQIGKLLAYVPIMFLIVIIMGIFILLASGASITHTKNVFKTEIVSQSYLMERNIVMFEKEMTIRKALLDVADNYALDRKIWLSAFDKSLRDFLSADAEASEASADRCLMIFAQIGGIDKVARTEKFLMSTEDEGDGFFSVYLRWNSDGWMMSDEGNKMRNVYSNVYSSGMRTFSLLTKNNIELNGVYYYGDCLE